MLVATALVAVAAEVGIRRGDAFRLSPFVTPTTATAGATSVVSLLQLLFLAGIRITVMATMPAPPVMVMVVVTLAAAAAVVPRLHCLKFRSLFHLGHHWLRRLLLQRFFLLVTQIIVSTCSVVVTHRSYSSLSFFC